MNVLKNEKAGRHADGQPEDGDQGKNFILNQVFVGDPEVVI
jgi:hypothetical protein